MLVITHGPLMSEVLIKEPDWVCAILLIMTSKLGNPLLVFTDLHGIKICKYKSSRHLQMCIVMVVITTIFLYGVEHGPSTRHLIISGQQLHQNTKNDMG